MATTQARDAIAVDAPIDHKPDRSSNDVPPYKRITDELFRRYGTPIQRCATHRH